MPTVLLSTIVSSLLSMLACTVLAIPLSAVDTYDPLRVPADAAPAEFRFTITLPDSKRAVPVRVLLSATSEPRPVVLFSHGLGGSCEGNDHFAHWAVRGYVVIYLQHPGSDTSVWMGLPRAKAAAALREAASAENFLLRAHDVRAVLDAAEHWQTTAGHPLAGRLDLTRVGMSGHSFGAVTTQAVAGQRFAGHAFADPRIRAAVALSPSPPHDGSDPATAFAAVTLPWLLMTGTLDQSQIGNITAADRLRVYPALPPGAAYELVLDRATHAAFTDRDMPGDRQPRNPQHHRAIIAISTAFWDAYLRADPLARAWLDGDGPRSVLADADRWQRK